MSYAAVPWALCGTWSCCCAPDAMGTKPPSLQEAPQVLQRETRAGVAQQEEARVLQQEAA